MQSSVKVVKKNIILVTNHNKGIATYHWEYLPVQRIHNGTILGKHHTLSKAHHRFGI